MIPALTEVRRRRAPLPARRQVNLAQESPTILRMRKQERQGRWPYEGFNEYLNNLMVAAGIPLSAKGTPNTMVFEEITGVDSARVSRWRQGQNQPTVESLRQVADSLAPLVGMDRSSLLAELEVKAGRRSQAEAQASVPQSAGAPAVDNIERRIRLIQIALDRPKIKPEERRELEIELVRAQAMKRMNDDAISSMDEVLRKYGHGA